MSSSNKTELGLNLWLGGDKPKREDFCNDNLIIDKQIIQRFREQNTKALEMQCFQGFFLFYGMLNNFCKHLKICPLVTR